MNTYSTRIIKTTKNMERQMTRSNRLKNVLASSNVVRKALAVAKSDCVSSDSVNYAFSFRNSLTRRTLNS